MPTKRTIIATRSPGGVKSSRLGASGIQDRCKRNHGRHGRHLLGGKRGGTTDEQKVARREKTIVARVIEIDVPNDDVMRVIEMPPPLPLNPKRK